MSPYSSRFFRMVLYLVGACARVRPGKQVLARWDGPAWSLMHSTAPWVESRHIVMLLCCLLRGGSAAPPWPMRRSARYYVDITCISRHYNEMLDASRSFRSNSNLRVSSNSFISAFQALFSEPPWVVYQASPKGPCHSSHYRL